MTADPRPPLAANPDPVKVVHVPVCRQCGKRAPWCSCGAADYSEPQPDRSPTP